MVTAVLKAPCMDVRVDAAGSHPQPAEREADDDEQRQRDRKPCMSPNRTAVATSAVLAPNPRAG